MTASGEKLKTPLNAVIITSAVKRKKPENNVHLNMVIKVSLRSFDLHLDISGLRWV